MKPWIHLSSSIILGFVLGWLFNLDLPKFSFWLILAVCTGVLFDWDHLIFAFLYEGEKTLKSLKTISFREVYDALVEPPWSNPRARGLRGTFLYVLVHGTNLILVYVFSGLILGCDSLPIQASVSLHFTLDIISNLFLQKKMVIRRFRLVSWR